MPESRPLPRAFEYRHIVGFEDTNLVGNVYFVNHFKWQGRCRELFLREHAPAIAQALMEDFALVTVRCSCEFYAELRAFDEVIVRMRLIDLAQTRLVLGFEYLRVDAAGDQIVARGEQEIACLQRREDRLEATPVPLALRRALIPFGAPTLER
jgi:enediyne core biosynthesis thioesterase